jgi:UDP-N-acetyl-D-mannosaminuronic acid dehydrogenase
LPGHVIRELVENDRIIGGVTPLCSEKAIELYRAFVKGECIVTNAKTAEMAKLTENASRDVGIAFANELSLICDDVNIDVWELIRLANRHPRVNILQPGPGVGGHCIAVDPWFIISTSPKYSKLIKTARQVNDSKPAWVIEKVKAATADFLLSNPSLNLSEVKISCYGLAFKPNIDDLRESPALSIATKLTEIFENSVTCIEPNISLDKDIGNLSLVEFKEAHEASDIHVLLVDHQEFKEADRPGGIVIDTKGIWGK